MQRHFGGHRDVAADADEVDVDQLTAGGVALDLPGEGEHRVTVELEVDQRVRAALPREDAAEVARRHGDGERVVAEAVDDGGHGALSAQPAGGTGAEFRPRGCGKRDVGHGARGLSEPGRAGEKGPEKKGGTKGRESTGCRPGTAR